MPAETDEQQPADDGDPTDDDRPEMAEEEMAAFGEVAEQIEAGENTEETDQTGEEPTEQDTDDTDEPAGSEVEDSGPDLSIGDIYCNGLGMVAAISRARYGSAEKEDREDLVEEYGDMARQIELDKYIDQWLQQSAGMDNLGPGQAVLLGTVMFGGMVVVDDPEMAENITQEVSA